MRDDVTSPHTVDLSLTKVESHPPTSEKEVEDPRSPARRTAEDAGFKGSASLNVPEALKLKNSPINAATKIKASNHLTEVTVQLDNGRSLSGPMHPPIFAAAIPQTIGLPHSTGPLPTQS